jgi:hypothetical protein
MIHLDNYSEIVNCFSHLLNTSRRHLTLIDPYLSLTDKMLEHLNSVLGRGIKVFIVTRQSHAESKLESISNLPNITLFFCNSMHDRCYFNESEMLVSSGGLQDGANICSGIFITRTDDLYKYKEGFVQKLGGIDYNIINQAVSDGQTLTDAIRAALEQGFKDTALDSIKEVLVKIHTEMSTITNRIGNIEAKIDVILKSVTRISDDTANIKNTNRDEDEKILKIYQCVDSLKSCIDSHNKLMTDYEIIVRKWVLGWDILEKTTQEFLLSAEFLYDKLLEIKVSDYSPFVLQYCRALENEILEKIFLKYNNVIQLERPNIDQVLKDARNNKKCNLFATNLLFNKTNYTLGQMYYVLALMDGEISDNSTELLVRFKQYCAIHFDVDIVESAFCAALKLIIDKYRNKAAHPCIMDSELASKCLDSVREILNLFLEYYRLPSSVLETSH